MRNRTWLLVPIVVLSSAVARAQDTQTVGRNGGGAFRDACGLDGTLYGLEGRMGGDLDQIRGRCRIQAARREGPDPVHYGATGAFAMPVRGGPGGEPFTLSCDSTPAPILRGIGVSTGDSGVVGALALICSTAGGEERLVHAGPVEAAPMTYLRCPQGTVAAGIHGGNGSLVDRLGLVCGPPSSLVTDFQQTPVPINSPVGVAVGPASPLVVRWSVRGPSADTIRYGYEVHMRSASGAVEIARAEDRSVAEAVLPNLALGRYDVVTTAKFLRGGVQVFRMERNVTYDVLAARPSAVRFSQGVLYAGGSVSGTVVLDAPARAAIRLDLRVLRGSSVDANVEAPASVEIPAGATSAPFTLRARAGLATGRLFVEISDVANPLSSGISFNIYAQGPSGQRRTLATGAFDVQPAPVSRAPGPAGEAVLGPIPAASGTAAPVGAPVLRAR